MLRKQLVISVNDIVSRGAHVYADTLFARNEGNQSKNLLKGQQLEAAPCPSIPENDG